MKKRYILLLAALLLLSGCTSGRKEAAVPELIEPAGVKMDTVTVVRGDMKTTTAYDAAVTAETHELFFEISGKIGSIDAYSGQWVEAGDVLMTLDQTDLKKEIGELTDELDYEEQDGLYADRLAELNIQLLNAEMDQLTEDGADNETIALKVLDIRQVELDAQQEKELRDQRIARLQNKLDGLNADYGRNVITAPCSGHVYIDSALTVGTPVHFGQIVANIADPSNLTVSVEKYLNLGNADPSTYYARIGDKEYSLQFIPQDSREMAAQIIAGKTVYSRFAITSDAEGLTAGQFAAVCVVSRSKSDVLQLPPNVIQSSSGERYVYVVTDSGLERRVISIGLTSDTATEIKEGLEEGEIVYVPD